MASPALIEARSVAYTNPAEGGTSGIYFVSVAERFGILLSRPARRFTPRMAATSSRDRANST
jgi:hypothetical protein